MPTIQPTRRRRIGIRVREDRVRVTERSGENLRVAEGVAIAVAQRQTGEVEVRPFTGHRVMPIGQVAIAQVRRQLVAEHAVADAVLVDIAVLAPQQSPGQNGKASCRESWCQYV